MMKRYVCNNSPYLQDVRNSLFYFKYFLTSSNIFILCVMLRIVTHILSFKCVAKNVSWQKQTYVFKNAKGISHVYGHNPNLWRPFRRSYVGRSEIINMVKTIAFLRNDLYTNNILNITKCDPLVHITQSSPIIDKIMKID